MPVLFAPQVMMTIDGVLSDILDLTDSGVQSALGTSRQELTGEWLIQQADYLAGRANMPPTQILGRAAFEAAEIVGLRYSSTKNASGFGIVVFTVRLTRGRQFLELYSKGSKLLSGRIP
jgi:hypothetical protein